MQDSRVPATMAALVALWTAAGALTWYGALVTGDPSDCLYVGYDGDPDGDFQAADDDSEWAGIGTRARDEEFGITCAAVALIGENDTEMAVANAYALMKLAADSLRTDPSLGFNPPYTASLKGGPLFIEPSGDGYQARKIFRVHVKTRI